MSPYVDVANVNILNGLLTGTIPLQPHLNLISGENGTLKTKLLQENQQGRYRPAPPGAPQLRIQAISPKRNSERRAVGTILQQLRQNSRTRDSFLAERLQAQMVDTQFQEYPSVGELFFLEYQYRSRDGGEQISHMDAVANDFNGVITTVFPEYRLLAEWDDNAGSPSLAVPKGGDNEVPLEALSLGEQEVLSLVANLYVSRDANDVYLVDEPEVHLNWHLEERLFGYFQDFCERHDKQMIIVTHSRVVFSDRFLPATIFLYWTPEGRIAWGNDITPAQRRRIAGEAIEIIKFGDFTYGTFFVEDKAQETVVKALADDEGVRIHTTVCGNAPNVRSLYKRGKADGGWPGTFFVEDGDNQGSPFPGETDFIHMDKYCIENYLLDFPTAATTTGKDEAALRQLVFDEVVKRKATILGKNKFLEFLFTDMRPEHLTPDRLATLDASLIFDGYLLSLGMTREDYVRRYVAAASQAGSLATVFPQQLIDAIRQSTPTGPPADNLEEREEANSPTPEVALE